MADAIAQGEVWWLLDDEPFSSEPGFTRPYLVVQSNSVNRSAIATIVACPLTRNLRLAAAPGNVLLRRGEAGLEYDSVVNVSGISSKARERFERYSGTVAPRRLRATLAGIAIILDPSDFLAGRA
jgi:mRNA interferase MazF